MANEATVTCGLSITVGKLRYSSQPSSFSADVSSSGGAGATPGQVLVTQAGTQVDLSKLTNKGGLCRVQNMDSTYIMQMGAYDGTTGRFFPIFDLLPGESFPCRLSTLIGNDYVGTGSISSDDALMLRVDPTAPFGTTLYGLVEAFNK